MADFRRRLERGIESLAGRICRRPLAVIFAVLLATVAAGTGLGRIEVDTSTESFLHAEDPVLARYEAFRDRFGRDDLLLVAVEPEELFSAPALDRLAALHADLRAEVPHVAEITSLVNARDTRGEGDRLVVGDLLATWPESDAERAALRARVLASPLYRNRLVSADGRVTTISVEPARYADTAGASLDSVLAGFDDFAGPTTGATAGAVRPPLTDAEIHALVTAVEAVLARHQREDFVLRLAGTPAVTDALKIALQADMRRFLALVVGIIALLLLLAFRSLAAILLPLGAVLLALVTTLGLMGHLGTAVTLPTIILPSFLLAVGVGAAIHLLSIFGQRIRRGEARERAVIAAAGHAGLPILLTSVTTAIGLGAFATAEVAPIADLGRFSALGVLIALVYTLALLPAGLVLLPPPRIGAPDTLSRRSGAAIDRFLAAVARWSVAHARPVTLVALPVLAASTLLAAQLRFSHDILAWLPEDWPVHQATRAIDRDLGGSVALEVVLDTGRENGLHDRETLLRLDRLAVELQAEPAVAPPVAATLSVADLLQEIHQALNGNRPEFHRIPENPRLIPQEFLLFENSGSDDLETLVDSGFRLARFSLRVPWRDTLAYPPLIDDVEARFAATFGPDAGVSTTGVMSLLSRTLDAAIRSAARSYLIAFGLISLLMILLVGRTFTGLLSMLPNLAPILLTLGLMQVAGVPLNLFTMLIASIAIGLAVDDTIHFMHHFHRYLAETGDVADSVRRTLATSGRAMLTTSLILSAGFFVFCLAEMRNLVDFGLLTGIAILAALAADLVLAPALMTLRYRHRPPPTGDPT